MHFAKLDDSPMFRKQVTITSLLKLVLLVPPGLQCLQQLFPALTPGCWLDICAGASNVRMDCQGYGETACSHRLHYLCSSQCINNGRTKASFLACSCSLRNAFMDLSLSQVLVICSLDCICTVVSMLSCESVASVHFVVETFSLTVLNFKHWFTASSSRGRCRGIEGAMSTILQRLPQIYVIFATHFLACIVNRMILFSLSWLWITYWLSGSYSPHELQACCGVFVCSCKFLTFSWLWVNNMVLMELQGGAWWGIWWGYCLCKCFGDLWRRPWWSN